ncbi:MAG: ferric reductase-like transmembrane domain-containing protein [Proteobacteria bacterium]|nr:ferric reductase-like transmembrane domain-containing protein [Pseudomonadota bacterium]
MSAVFGRVRDHWSTAWIVLSLPAIPMILAAAEAEPDWGTLLHISGEFSARLLVVTLVLTPLKQMTHWRWVRWLLARRRWLGVASFGYAALHLVFYALDEGLLAEFTAPDILSGWLAFALFVALAVTSTDGAVRAMGKNWKRLQRWTYVAAVLTLIHWVLLEFELGPALVHAAPVVGLRLAAWWRRRRP